MTPGTTTAARPTTTQRTVDHLVAAVYAAACFAAVLAPALAVRWAVFRSDIAGVAGRDIVAASVLVGAGHAAVAWTRLRCEKRTAARRSHIWIASLNALVVLALSASLLVLAVLRLFADEHAAMVNRGVPVVALWAGLQLGAVALAEITGRLVFWWLEPRPAPHRACRWGVLPPARRLVRLPHPTGRTPVPAAVQARRSAPLDTARWLNAQPTATPCPDHSAPPCAGRRTPPLAPNTARLGRPGATPSGGLLGPIAGSAGRGGGQASPRRTARSARAFCP